MLRLVLVVSLALVGVSSSAAAPIPEADIQPTGILVLDDCDDKYEGKQEYQDNLTMFGPYGKQRFRVTGFNNCESIGSNHMIAADRERQCVWVIENVAHRVRRFDLAGKETHSIPNVDGSAIAIDPETGNVWALQNNGRIDGGGTVVYSPEGKVVAKYEESGWDIVYDPKGQAIWLAGKDLTKISTKSGAVSLKAPIAMWCASSVDVDPNTGAVWVTCREHEQVLGSSNLLLKFDADGKEIAAVALKEKNPFRVSVDPTTGSVWVETLRKSIERYSSVGELEASHAIDALAVQVDPAGRDCWVVTGTEAVKLSPKCQVKARVPHAGKTSQAWITKFD